MTQTLSPVDIAKQAAARAAAALVESGMTVGLGTGSTAAWLLRCLGARVRDEGLEIRGVPTSRQTEELARQEGIPVVSLDEARWLDITIDGADAVDPDLNLIKGGGGALLREKIVAAASDRMVVIADRSKAVAALGAFPLPVEVVPFGWQTTQALVEETLQALGGPVPASRLRLAGATPFVTDQGNHILDLQLERIGNPRHLAMMLNQIPGVVENGLFIDLCDRLVIGEADGRVEIRDAAAASPAAAAGSAAATALTDAAPR